MYSGFFAASMDVGLTREAVTERLYQTLDANGMDEGVHVRLMVTRGVRSTPYQDPRVVVTPATVVVVPEYKQPPEGVHEHGCTPTRARIVADSRSIRASKLHRIES